MGRITHILNIQTLNGKTQTSSKKVKVDISQGVQLEAFVVDTKINIDKPKVKLTSLWPSLETEV